MNNVDMLFVLVLRRAARREREKDELIMLIYARHPNEKLSKELC